MFDQRSVQLELLPRRIQPPVRNAHAGLQLLGRLGQRWGR